MAETLATYTAMVQSDVDETSVSAKPTIEMFVKQTYQEVLRFAGRYLLGMTTTDEVAVVGTAHYDKSTFDDIDHVLYRQDGASVFVELDRITESDYVKFYINSDLSTPSYWYRNGLGINLVPTPNDSGTIRVMGTPVSGDVDGMSVIPSRYNDVVRYGSSAKYFAFDKDPAAVEYFELYDRAKRAMLLDLMTQSGTLKPKFFA